MTTELQPADAGSWWSWITNYDQTLQQFNDAYNTLIGQANYITTQHPELLSTYNDLVARAQDQLNTLNSLKATRDYVYSWLDWLGNGAQQGVNFLTSAASNTYNYLMSSLGLSGLAGLGIAPVVVIGVAAAAAALVVIGYWIKDAIAFNQRVAALQQQEQALIAAGVPPAQAIQQAQGIVNNTLGPAPGSAASINSNLLGIPWTWIITGAVLVFLGPPLIEAMSGKGKSHE
jgi:hypothetical protein